MIVTLLALCVWWARHIDGTAVEDDAAQGLRMALSLERHGVISLQTAAPLTPSMYREPLPIAINAALIRLHDRLYGQLPDSQYFSGPALKFLKLQNIVWMLLLSIGAFVAVQRLSASSWLAVLCVVLVSCKVPLVPSGLDYLGVNGLETDLPAAALLIAGSTLLMMGMAWRRLSLQIAAGAVFGALALTKAAFLYVFTVLALMLIVSAAVLHKRLHIWRLSSGPVAVVICFCLVTLGWMMRNLESFGVFGISERGGVVLLIRAFKDQMSSTEYRGSFYVWSPAALKPALGKLLGFSPQDLQRGGRLQRLNRTGDADFYRDDVAAESAGRPDLTITYYRKARAERVRLRRQLDAAGQDPVGADQMLKVEAMHIIEEHPGAHLLLTVPLLWRGALLAFPALLLAWGLSVRSRDPELFWFVQPALGLVMFYALLSHFIPRYSVPMHPVAICAALLLLAALWNTLRSPSSEQR